MTVNKKTPRVIVKDRVLIPVELVSKRALAKHYEFTSFDDKACEKCDHVDERPCDSCYTCPAYGGRYEYWEKRSVNGEPHIAVPAPDIDRALDLLKVPESVRITDRRPIVRMKKKLKFTGSLYTGQVVHGATTVDQGAITKKWLKSVNDGGGVIRLPPRGGKTHIATFLTCALGYRTLILASQIDWLVQFCEAFAKQTNATSWAASPVVLVCPQAATRRKVEKWGIRTVSKWEKVPANADVVLSTYQALMNNQTRFKAFVADKFSFLVVDEVHQSPAAAFTRVLTRMQVRVRLGLTATYDRKDGLSRMLPHVMGEIKATSNVEALVPRIELEETGLFFRPYTQWAYLENAMSRSDIRNKLIVQRVFNDLRSDPRHCILIPVRRVEQVKTLVNMINATAFKLTSKGEEDWPTTLAIEWTGKSPREKVLDKARKAKVRVVVAIEKIVKHGLSVGPWSIVYIGMTPTSNGPMFYQLARRVGTPHPNKPQTIVRWWLDANTASIGCLRNLWFSKIDGVLSGLRDSKEQPRRYCMDKAHFDRIFDIIKNDKLYLADAKAGAKRASKRGEPAAGSALAPTGLGPSRYRDDAKRSIRGKPVLKSWKDL